MKLKQFLIGVGGVAVASTPLLSYAETTLNGAGATFPYPFYARIFSDYSKVSNTRVNYASVGSGAGIRQFVAGTVDFAATDEPIKPKDAAKVKRGFVQIPMTGGTIAIAYNKPGCKLKLTQKQVVSIFQGDITDYKQVGCAAGKLNVVHRSDGSGTTFAFTNSLDAFGGWTSGVGKSINWKVGVGAKGNEGVAGTIKNTPGGIGYLNTGFVRANKLQVAVLQNKSGNYVGPSAATGFAALNGIELDPVTLAGENPNPPAPKAYPISTLTWILAYKTGNGEKTDDIRSAINYMLSSKAQMIADDLGYVPLAGSVLNKARIKVNQISK